MDCNFSRRRWWGTVWVGKRMREIHRWKGKCRNRRIIKRKWQTNKKSIMDIKNKQKHQLHKWSRRNLLMDRIYPKRLLLYLPKLSIMIDPLRNNHHLCHKDSSISILMRKYLSTPIKILWHFCKDKWQNKILKMGKCRNQFKEALKNQLNFLIKMNK